MLNILISINFFQGKIMKTTYLFLFFSFIYCLTFASTPKVSPLSNPGITENYCLNNVVASFNGIPTNTEGVRYAVRINTSESNLEPTSFHHFQGFDRINTTLNSAYFLGTLSLHEEGDFVVWSHTSNGSQENIGSVEGPFADDKMAYYGGSSKRVFSVNGLAKNTYNHPSGIQCIGKYCAIASDNWCGTHGHPPLFGGSTVTCKSVIPKNVIQIFEFSNPNIPTLVKNIWEHETLNGLGVAITRMADSRYLVALPTPNDDGHLIFLKSSGTNINDSYSEYWHWKNGDPNFVSGGEGNWNKHQNFNLLQQCDGKVFLTTFDNSSEIGSGKDESYLYEIGFSSNGNTGNITLTGVGYKHFDCGSYCNFKASGNTYVTPSGNLIVYGTGHDNTGSTYSGDSQGSQKFMEWRSETVGYNGIVGKNCGLGTGYAAYVELYEHDNYSRRMVSQKYSSSVVTVSNITTFGSTKFGHNADSVRWCAPSGCTIRLHKKNDFDTHKDLTGNNKYPSLDNEYWLDKDGNKKKDSWWSGGGTDYMGDDLEKVSFIGSTCSNM